MLDRNTCYKYGHEGHLTIDCHTEEDFPAIQLSGEIHSSRAGVKEGVESVTVSQVPATTRHGVEREEVPVQTISQDAVDPEGNMEATNITGTEYEAARGENMDRMEEIEEVTCIMSPSRNKNDANKKDQNKLVKNELELTAVMMKIK
ncbi:hypothetical protein Hamer_G014856 [Homarus americanus]|uniref:Uncharacterized protein n=1 Tax=Homarus americanus TaxID=6706 RepID=A0A8J5MNV8_HOMAM|nr:hypothetical protein Hamer_G014856 [Homarus americanus]